MNHEPVQAAETRGGVLGLVREPWDISLGMWLFYVALTALATSTVIHPPRTVLTYMGDHVSWLWPSLWVLGGVVGIISAIPGWWILERAGLILIFSGSMLYFFATLEAQISGEGNRWGHMTAIMIGSWFLWYRFRTIYLHDINPEKA